MTRSFSREISRRNVTVNCVAPGFIVTEMTSVLSDDILKQAKAGIPARKLGQVADVAACVTFLASGAASYVTGQTLTVDGGMTG
jgi:3-oxoacyl-[acyl-carrier protein] reductase